MKMTRIFLSLPAVLAVLMLLAGGCGVKRKVPPGPDETETQSEETVVESGSGEIPAAPAKEDPLKPGGGSGVSTENIAVSPPAPPAAEGQSAAKPLDDILFDYDKATLTQSARERLGETARWLKENGAVKVRIEGHADERGSSEYNIALGDSRAEAVKRYLVDLGTASNRLSTISYGEEMPLDPAQTEEAYAKNRRVHFEIVK